MVVAPVFVWGGARCSPARSRATASGGRPRSSSPPHRGRRRRAPPPREARRAQARARRARAYLARGAASVFARPASERPDRRELSADDLRSLRYVLDRALQPIGELRGFDRIDQFQTSPLRYQLNHAANELAEIQCAYTPSFHGYLSLA
jgi:hypothetical protein